MDGVANNARVVRARWGGGALLAAAAAGPLFAAPFLLTAGYGQHGLIGIGGGVLATAALAVVTLPVGFIIAVLPSLAGAAALVSAGRHRRWTRHPLIWAASGFAIGCAVGAALIGNSGTTWSAADVLAGTWPFGICGAVSALVARRRTRWRADPT